MNDEELKNLGEKIFTKVMKHWSKFDTIGKKQLEEGLDIIVKNISKNTKTPIEVVAQHTHSIIENFPNEYQQVPDDMKGYEAMIAMLYSEYMKELGFLGNKPD